MERYKNTPTLMSIQEKTQDLDMAFRLAPYIVHRSEDSLWIGSEDGRLEWHNVSQGKRSFSGMSAV